MSSYVRRTRLDGRVSWTGPIRSTVQAGKEAAAWNDTGGRWSAVVLPSSPLVRAAVRAWVKVRAMERAS